VARIRIVDEWLRSPVSTPTRQRAVVVVADSWSEQRVLMRAFSGSTDQTRPTIRLGGDEVAIGPAGVDPHGPWAIHVEPPVDGRAQLLRGQLEEAARRLAGARGRPPRLQDEEPEDERRPTDVWMSPGRAQGSQEPATALPPAVQDDASASGRRRALKQTEKLFPIHQAARGAGERAAPAASAAPDPGRATVLGTGVAEPMPAGDALAAVVHRTMPLGFRLSAAEREVLNALGKRGELGAVEIAALAGTGDGARWMRALIAKLAEHGLDLVVAGEGKGEPRFSLRR
jgi:hypothetical protein